VYERKLDAFFLLLQGDPAPSNGTSASLPERFKVNDAFLTVAGHLRDDQVLLGSTDAPQCIMYVAVGRLTASGSLIEIIKKGTIVKLSCGGAALVMGIVQDKVGPMSLEPYLITQPLPAGKLKPIFVSKAAVLKNYPAPHPSILEGAARLWDLELAKMLPASPPEDAAESVATLEGAQSSEESDSDSSSDSDDSSSSGEESDSNKASSAGLNSEQRASIEEDNASSKASDDSDNENMENMEPNEEEGNKSPGMVATWAASATVNAAPRRSSRAAAVRRVSVDVAPTVPAPKKPSKKKQAKPKATTATGKPADGAKKAPVVDLALILEKPSKRGIMRLTAEQLDKAYASKSLDSRPPGLAEARKKLVGVLLDKPAAMCNEVLDVSDDIGRNRVRPVELDVNEYIHESTRPVAVRAKKAAAEDTAPAWAQDLRGDVLSLKAEVKEQADFKEQLMSLIMANGGMPSNNQPSEMPKKRQMGSSDDDKEGKTPKASGQCVFNFYCS